MRKKINKTGQRTLFKLIFLTFFALSAFILVCQPENVYASMKLKKIHASIKQSCKDCHHKFKQGYNPPPGVRKSTKRCSQCHMYNARKVAKFEQLSNLTKKMHLKCRNCHVKHRLKNQSKKIHEFIRKSSQCKVCHSD
jgi:hypothetical protein